MRRNVFVQLYPHELDALGQLAAQERRPLKAQGAVLVVEGLKHRGLLPAAPLPPADEPIAAAQPHP
jgi:hypothetical protein